MYVGNSPLHSSTVGLIRNLRTGNISPQFHVVYDDYFETVLSTPEKEPENWEEIVVFQSFRLSLEEDNEFFNYELDPERLSEAELEERTKTRLPGGVSGGQREERVPQWSESGASQRELDELDLRSPSTEATGTAN